MVVSSYLSNSHKMIVISPYIIVVMISALLIASFVSLFMFLWFKLAAKIGKFVEKPPITCRRFIYLSSMVYLTAAVECSQLSSPVWRQILVKR